MTISAGDKIASFPPLTPLVRQTQWGHWGITFYEAPAGAYAPNKIHGTVQFAVGARGPVDSGPVRERYTEYVRAWRDEGKLPEELIPWSPQ